MSIKIRMATKEDGGALLGIYESYIMDTAITFETVVPSVAEFAERIENVLECFPWLVCEIDEKVVGYAYASKHRARAAYQWSADLSVYIDARYHRMHIATALYTALIELLKLQGYYTVFAGVTTPNQNSEALHAAFGFETIGVFQNVGYKYGNWRDVKWFALSLSDYQKEPELPITIHDVVNEKVYEEIVNKAEKMIRSPI